MPPVLDRSTLRSKVTTKAQTTLPSGVRKALGVVAGDELEYVIEGDRAVVTKAVGVADLDPVLGRFLDLLERDMMAHPERVQGMPHALMERMSMFRTKVRVNHAERIEGAVSI